jgi:hypothetical protein
MTTGATPNLRTASGETLVRLIHETSAQALLPLLDNPVLDERILAVALQRRDLPPEFLDEVLHRRHLLKAYRIRKLLAFHPHTPRNASLHFLRELYLMDLIQFGISPGVSPDLKIKAEEQVIAKLPQLPLGQKITLARRAPARITAALLAEGQRQVITAALSNRSLTEAQILKVLARQKLPPAIAEAIAQHDTWSRVYNVRVALIRQPATTLTTVLSYLPELTISDLRELAAPGILPENLRHYLQAEIQSRLQRRIASSVTPSDSGDATDQPE